MSSGGEVAPQPDVTLFRLPPGLLFHLSLLVPASVLVYSVSFPGIAFFMAMAGFWTALIFVAIWLVRCATYLLARHRKIDRGRARSFLVAPAIGILVIGLVFTGIPFQARWALSRGAFENAVASAPPPTGLDEEAKFDTPFRIGSYRITRAYRTGDAVIFQEATGALFNNAGFAYLPSGPFPELDTGRLERPQFRALGGDWYAWTASW